MKQSQKMFTDKTETETTGKESIKITKITDLILIHTDKRFLTY
jgi:hypothetical protein